MPDRLLPNWIQAYLAYTAELESPDEFHIWTALSTIAGAVRRKAFFDMGYFLLYPNLYVVLVSPPGVCKKSTAMRVGRGFLAKIPEVSFSTDSITRERLIQDLSQSFKDGHSSLTAYSTEFASLLTSSGMDMVVFLTDIYDSPEEWTHKTKVGGTNKIKAPYFNLEGATTPDWIARSLPLDTVGIGMTSRILFIYQDVPRIRDPFPELSPEQKALEGYLTKDLERIAQIGGNYVLSPEAKEYYRDWYKNKRHESRIEDNRLSGYYERKPMHLLKVSMLISASEKDDLILTTENVESAMGLLDDAEPAMLKTFSAVGKNPLTLDIDQIMMAIFTATDGIAISDLMGRFKHSVRKDELVEVLDTLAIMGKIKVVQKGTGPVYFPVR